MRNVSKRTVEWIKKIVLFLTISLSQPRDVWHFALIDLSYMLITLYATIICSYTLNYSSTTKFGFFFKLCWPSIKRMVPLL